MEDDLKIERWNISAITCQILHKFETWKLKMEMENGNWKWKLKMKKTSHERRPQKLKIVISQQPLVRSYPNLKLRLMGPSQRFRKLKRKTTFHGRNSQKRKEGISQQPLVGSYPKSKLRLRGPSQMLLKLTWRRPFKEDVLLSRTTPYFLNGRQPQKWKVVISQQTLVRSYPNLKLRLREPRQMLWKLEMKMTSHGRQP